MVATRPDIARAVRLVSMFTATLGRAHWEAIKSISRYLKGPEGKCRCYGKGPLELKEFCDSDMVGDVDTCKFTSGYASGAISWCSRLQRIVALSTAKAEYISVTKASVEAILLARLCNEFGMPKKEPILGCDSQSAIRLAKNEMFHARTKHIDVRYQFIKEAIGWPNHFDQGQYFMESCRCSHKVSTQGTTSAMYRDGGSYLA